jgi:hypothetical protein
VCPEGCAVAVNSAFLCRDGRIRLRDRACAPGNSAKKGRFRVSGGVKQAAERADRPKPQVGVCPRWFFGLWDGISASRHTPTTVNTCFHAWEPRRDTKLQRASGNNGYCDPKDVAKFTMRICFACLHAWIQWGVTGAAEDRRRRAGARGRLPPS